MPFRTFDRRIFAKLETTEGTPIATQADDYIETIEPTFSITNREYDRNPTRLSITPAPKTVTGTGEGLGLPSASVEMSFGVELAGFGTEAFYSSGYSGAETAASIPKFGRLLQACGMQQLDAVRGVAALNATPMAINSGSPPTPYILRHRERVASGASSINRYTQGTVFGRCFGTQLYQAGAFFYSNAGIGTCSDAAHNNDETACIASDTWTFTDPAASKRIYGQATSVWAGTVAGTSPFVQTAGSGVAAQRVGPGWCPTSGSALGGSNGTSLTIDLYVSDSDQYIQATGCRGNVEFVFTSGDRVLMNFTFTGKLEKYSDTSSVSPRSGTSGSIQPPPGCTDFNLEIYNGAYGLANDDKYTGAVFNAMTLNLGNEVTIRENMSDSTGYDAAYITGRSTSLTFNPDADVMSSNYDFWGRFLSGETTSMEWTVGEETPARACGGNGNGNSFYFRIPAMQFSGIADGNRDEVMVLDSTTTLTGGDMGESMLEGPASADLTSTPIDPRLGTDNEFTLLLF